MYATWVDPDGSTNTELVVMGTFNPLPQIGGIAISYGDQGYLIAYVVPADGGSVPSEVGSPVLGLRLDRDGHALDTQPFLLSSNTFAGDVPAVAWTGAQYVVVWTESVSTNNAVAEGARVLADGTILDPGGFMVTALGGILNLPRLAWGGGVLMMVAGPSSNTTGGIDSVTLDTDGRNPQPFSLPGTGVAGDSTSPGVAWNGTDFVVTWLDGGGRLAAARMRAAGTAVDTTAFVFTTAFDISQMPRVAVSGGTAQVIYIAASDNYRIHELSLSATGTTNHPPAGLVNAASAQQLLAIGRGDGQTLVVWSDAGNGQNASLQAARVADDGSVLDATARVLGAFGIQAQRLAGAGFASGTYLVAWWDAQNLSAVRAARVSAAGVLLDTTPILVASDVFQPPQVGVGYDGQSFVVSWSKVNGSSFTQGPASAQRVGLDGTLAGSAFTFGPTNVDMGPSTLATQNNGCIAAWAEPDFPSHVRVGAIGPGGVVGPPRTPAAGLTNTLLPALVPVGTQMLLWGGRAGAIIGATDPFTASGQMYSVPRDIGTPTWDGMMFVGATPSVVAFELPSAGVDVSVMGADGTLADAVTVTDKTLPVSNPTSVGLGNGRSLLVYSRLLPDSHFGNFQVRFQILDTTTPGDGGVRLDAGMDSATAARDGGVLSIDAAPADSGSDASVGSRDGGAVAEVGDEASPDRPPSVDASVDVFDASAVDLRADASADVQADSRPDVQADSQTDARAGTIDGPAADRGADAAEGLGGRGCSCAVETGRGGTSWASIAVALALLTARRRRRSRS